MRTKYILIAGLVAAFALSCSQKEEDKLFLEQSSYETFYAYMENTDTKVFADDLLRVLWDADDRVSIFNKYTYNQEYRFDGETGDNAGVFKKVPSEDFVTGNALDYIYSVYPYIESTKIDNDGVITIDMPAEQKYREDSFGIGANTMIAITEDNQLLFKNLCGYLIVKLYGDDVTVKSLSLKGNKEEPLSGKANVTAVMEEAPEITFSETATREITLTCENPVKIGTTPETATTFWLVVPPCVLSEGFTLNMIAPDGSIFEKSTTNKLEISRNIITRMEALEALPSIPGVVAKISLNKNKLTMPIGTSELLTATIYPESASDNPITWTSSAPSIAKVDDKGKVTAISVGETTITATSSEHSAECTVIVKLNESFSVWDGQSVSFDWYTRSTDKKEFHIRDASELAGLSEAFSEGYYKYGNFKDCIFYLDSNIDLANYEWTPIGIVSNHIICNFLGVFEGNGATIRGLRITKLNDNDFITAGLFGAVYDDGFVIRNLMVDCSYTIQVSPGTLNYVGGIVGYMHGRTTIQNCHTNITINVPESGSEHWCLGGIVGYANSSVIVGCSSKGAINVITNGSEWYSGDLSIGGIAGSIEMTGTISRCSSSSEIFISGLGQKRVGGVVGRASGNVVIDNVVFSGYCEINEVSAVLGGIVGYVDWYPFNQTYDPEGMTNNIIIINGLMIGSYSSSSNLSLSAIVGVFGGNIDDFFSVNNTYYLESLESYTSYGNPISAEMLMSGTPLPGYDTSIWDFQMGCMPQLIFD